MSKRFIDLVLAFVAACASTPLLARDAERCAELADFALPEVELTITQAAWAADREVIPPGLPSRTAPPPGVRLPPHCHVEGHFDRRIGVNGQEFAIRFALNLPDEWNRRFVFQGSPGTNGVVDEPGLVAFGLSAVLQGFAVVDTDGGHVLKPEAPLDFLDDQTAAMNFFYVANLKVDRVARRLTEAYYQAEIERAYFVGGSNGGREGLLMAQRSPERFDGIIAIAPAFRLGVATMVQRIIRAAFNRTMAVEGSTASSGERLFSAAERRAVADAVRAHCDGLDGLEDSLIFNTRACNFDPRELVCPSAGGGPCLSAAKVDALGTVFGPIETAAGITVHPGFMFDTGIDDAAEAPPASGLLTQPAVVPGSDPVSVLEIDVDAEYIAALTDDSALGDAAAVNLSTFSARGGKLMIFHGNSDPVLSALDTAAWYERMSAANGGIASARSWSRLFFVPGMLHCPCGEATVDDFSALSLIVDWVENGTAPDRVIATGRSMPGISRPLCPFPSYAHYSGAGPETDAASFECRD